MVRVTPRSTPEPPHYKAFLVENFLSPKTRTFRSVFWNPWKNPWTDSRCLKLTDTSYQSGSTSCQCHIWRQTAFGRFYGDSFNKKLTGSDCRLIHGYISLHCPTQPAETSQPITARDDDVIYLWSARTLQGCRHDNAAAIWIFMSGKAVE